MTLIKDMISSFKIQLLKAPFLVYLIAIDYSEVIYDTKENINPFWNIRAYTLELKRKGTDFIFYIVILYTLPMPIYCTFKFQIVTFLFM